MPALTVNLELAADVIVSNSFRAIAPALNASLLIIRSVPPSILMVSIVASFAPSAFDMVAAFSPEATSS